MSTRVCWCPSDTRALTKGRGAAAVRVSSKEFSSGRKLSRNQPDRSRLYLHAVTAHEFADNRIDDATGPMPRSAPLDAHSPAPLPSDVWRPLLHAAKLAAPSVERGAAEAMLAAQLLDRNAGLRLFPKSAALCFGTTLLHVRPLL